MNKALLDYLITQTEGKEDQSPILLLNKESAILLVISIEGIDMANTVIIERVYHLVVICSRPDDYFDTFTNILITNFY